MYDFNVLEDGAECESFITFLLIIWFFYENKYDLQVFLKSCAYKIVDKQMIDYLDDNIFETDEN